MCVLLSMGTHCTTCFTQSPISDSSSTTNLTPHENADMEFQYEPHLVSPTSNSSHIANSDALHRSPSLKHIHEEQEQKHDAHHKHTPQNIRVSKLIQDVPSDTVTPTMTFTATNTPCIIPPNPPTTATATSSEDAEIDIYTQMKSRDTGRLSKPIPFETIFNKMKMKNNTKYHGDGPEYTKATSIETNTTASSIKTASIKETEEIENGSNEFNIPNQYNANESENDDEDSDTPGPPPKLLLFNNSNRPPLVNFQANKRSSDTIQRSRTFTVRNTVDRLKIPPLTTLNHSVSAFDELGRRLNHLPSFQRTLTSSSITSLTHSQSIQLSFENTLNTLKLRDNAPSFHSLKSFRTSTSTHSLDNNNPFNVTPITHSSQHPVPSFDIIQSRRVSQTPSLPSISANDTLADMDNIPSTKLGADARNMLIHSHRSRSDSMKHVNPLDLIQKRVLFVSIVQLHRSYLNGIPSFIIEHAVFAFGIKRIWLFPKTAHDVIESKESYIQHFKTSWSKEFIEMIANKDAKGHVLWIEPCIASKTHSLWVKISDQLTKIVDLSVPEEETNKKRIELQRKQLSIEEEKEVKIEEEVNESYITDNELVSRIPSDRTDSIPPIPSVTSNTPMSFKFETNNNSLQTIDDDEDDNNHKKQLSIAETLLTIHHSKEDALKIGAFDTVYMMTDEEDYDDDHDEDIHTDSSYDEDTEAHKCTKMSMDISLTNLDEKGVKSRESHRDVLTIYNNNKKKETKKMIISVEDTSKQDVISVSECEYMPYYHKLQLDGAWWRSKYEPIRRSQSDQQKRALAESAKLISRKLSHPSPHHNESVNLSITPIKSLFNIEGEAVLKQLRCISSPNDIKLKPIKELFYQSNPTLIPMEYFQVNKYIEYHIDAEQKYCDILAYCERYLVVQSINTLTPSTSNNSSNNQSKHHIINNNNHNIKMEMLDDDEDEDGIQNEGFQMIDNISSNHSLDVINEVNVDESGMVYMFDYDDNEDEETEYELFEDETLLNGFRSSLHGSIITNKPNLPYQTSIQSIKSDSELPFSGKLRGGSSESSIKLWD